LDAFLQGRYKRSLGESTLQAGVATGNFTTLTSLMAERCPAGLSETDVRYLCAFSKVEIPVLDKLTLSEAYQLIGKP
jgi:hypothetical protein